MRYEAPETVESATALLAGTTGEARILAGGTDLLVQLRGEVVDPALIVSVESVTFAVKTGVFVTTGIIALSPVVGTRLMSQFSATVQFVGLVPSSPSHVKVVVPAAANTQFVLSCKFTEFTPA